MTWRYRVTRGTHHYPNWADPRFPYDPKWGWVIKSECVTEWGRVASEALRQTLDEPVLDLRDDG